MRAQAGNRKRCCTQGAGVPALPDCAAARTLPQAEEHERVADGTNTGRGLPTFPPPHNTPTQTMGSKGAGTGAAPLQLPINQTKKKKKNPKKFQRSLVIPRSRPLLYARPSIEKAAKTGFHGARAVHALPTVAWVVLVVVVSVLRPTPYLSSSKTKKERTNISPLVSRHEQQGGAGRTRSKHLSTRMFVSCVAIIFYFLFN